jgi:hypothetical protein
MWPDARIRIVDTSTRSWLVGPAFLPFSADFQQILPATALESVRFVGNEGSSDCTRKLKSPQNASSEHQMKAEFVFSSRAWLRLKLGLLSDSGRLPLAPR